MADEPFLSRWSKRKTAVRTGSPVPAEAVPPAVVPAAQAATSPAVPAEPREPLPDVESLTPESDFTGFMQPEVDEGLKRRALRTLFRDPRFNVMDGLDTYIDDYSKPDPIPESWFSQMNQMARLGAFEEKPVEPEEPPLEAPQPATEPTPEAVEKPSAEQGLAPPPSGDTSDTADGAIPAPPVPE